jgi:enamine deaminase RidA (YjgF/YER057c/UK114 family)
MSKRIIDSPQAPAPVGPYSQGVVLDGWIFTSGQVALDPETGASAPETPIWLLSKASKCRRNSHDQEQGT